MALPQILLGAAAAGALYLGYKKVTEKTAPAPPPFVDPKNLPGLVSALQKGRTYAVLVVLDWTKIPGATPTTPDKDSMANYLKLIFGGGPGASPPDGLGFKVLSTPTLRDAAESTKFFAGQPSTWVLNAQWLKDDTGPTGVAMTPDLNKVLPNAAFYLLPVA